MHISGTRFCGIFVILAVIFLTATTVTHAGVLQAKTFEIVYDGLSKQDVRAAAAEIRDAIERLTAFFGRPLRQKVRIEVKRSGLKSTVFDKEFRIIYPESRIRQANRIRDASFVHDLAILFEHADGEEHKGLLTIGLATYLQSEFTPGKNVFPTDGDPLDEKTADLIDQQDWLIPLALTTEVRKGRQKTATSRRLAMLEQGSFVKYLIGHHGLEKFFRYYRGTGFQTVYGIPRCRAEVAWFDHLTKAKRSIARLAETLPDCS